MPEVAARTTNWRLLGGAALLIAAILCVPPLVTGILWIRVIPYGVLALGLAIVAVGQTEAERVRGKIALWLFAAGYAIIAVGYTLASLPPFTSFGWTPLIVIGISLYALFGAAVLFGIVDALAAAWALWHKSSRDSAVGPYMFAPTVLGVTAFAGLLSMFLPWPEWLAFVFPIACVAGALYLLIGRRAGS